MRALFFVDVPHRFTGAQRSLLASVSRIHEFGIEPVVVFPSSGICFSAFRDAGIRTEVVQAPARLLVFQRGLLRLGAFQMLEVLARDMVPYADTLQRFARGERVEVFHYNAPRGILVAGLAARALGLPSVLHHRAFANFSRKHFLLAELLADRIVLVSRALEADIDPAFLERTRVVYNGVPVDFAEQRGAESTLPAELSQAARSGRLVLALASPIPLKGLHHLVAAAARLRHRGFEAQFAIVGVGEDAAYESWLREQSRDLGVSDCVHFLGYTPDPRPLLRAAEILVLPTVDREELRIGSEIRQIRGREGLPRSVLEAMSHALPVVATDVGGTREEVVHGVTGILVPPSDAEALAAALEKALLDEAWRRSAGLKGRERVRAMFSIEAASRGLADVLKEAARVRKGDPV